MRKLAITLTLVATVMLFQFCHNSKKIAATPMVTFENNVLPVVKTSCAPCHVNGPGALVNYAVAKEKADDIIRRIQLDPTERGFMPLKHPKLSDTAITAFVDWKKGGLLEK